MNDVLIQEESLTRFGITVGWGQRVNEGGMSLKSLFMSHCHIYSVFRESHSELIYILLIVHRARLRNIQRQRDV